MAYVEPTARSDPLAYLALRKFSLRLPLCPRTKLPVSYADIGDSAGVPVLWMLPSGCSRWFAAPQDPLAKRNGIRLILVDRPGVGATPDVDLADRIDISCQMILSVLEHLDVQPRHMIVTSAGMYYALHMLLNYPEAFGTILQPPPFVYFVAPWSPLLPADHPDYYPSYFTWIPSQIIATQHITLPQLLKLARTGTSLWNTGLKTLWSTLDSAKSLISGNVQPPAASSKTSGSDHIHENGTDLARETGMVPSKMDEAEQEGDLSEHASWGRFPCCVSCTTTDYFQAEHFAGVGQEHLICLNRGPVDTGHVWLEQTVLNIATKIQRNPPIPTEKRTGDEERAMLHADVWWGWQDNMVPRKGQLWFNKTLERYKGQIRLTVHDVPDGDHTDLLNRAEGIYEVYDMIRERG